MAVSFSSPYIIDLVALQLDVKILYTFKCVNKLIRDRVNAILELIVKEWNWIIPVPPGGVFVKAVDYTATLGLLEVLHKRHTYPFPTINGKLICKIGDPRNPINFVGMVRILYEQPTLLSIKEEHSNNSAAHYFIDLTKVVEVCKGVQRLMLLNYIPRVISPEEALSALRAMLNTLPDVEVKIAVFNIHGLLLVTLPKGSSDYYLQAHYSPPSTHFQFVKLDSRNVIYGGGGITIESIEVMMRWTPQKGAMLNNDIAYTYSENQLRS